MEKETNFQPDDSQREVIKAEGGYHLVLAPPGCGKTQILTERIRRAHQKDGVAYSDMLCLTFTNRAARGMMELIRENITDDDISQVLQYIEEADKRTCVDAHISSIIKEEAGAYLNGAKSAEQTADIIQRRVKIYIKEMM